MNEQNTAGEIRMESDARIVDNVLLETRNLTKVYEETGEHLEILRGVDFAIQQGEVVVLTGSSGSGKSTFLNLVGALDQPTAGSILFKGQDLAKLKPQARDHFHRHHIGFVFQFHHLLAEFTALENVMLPARVAGAATDECRDRAARLLETVGLGDRSRHLPRELSGGERQRVAVARALMNAPDVVLADEPSGNLDEGNAVKLHRLFADLNQSTGQTFLIVTHDARLAALASRRVSMHGGLIVPN